MMLTYLVFLGSSGTHESHDPMRSDPKYLQISFASGIIILAVCCILFRIEYWPFSDFRVFIHKVHYDNIEIYKYLVSGKF